MQLTFAARRGRHVFQQLNRQQKSTFSTRASITVSHVRRVFRLPDTQPAGLSKHGKSIVGALNTSRRNNFATTSAARAPETTSETDASTKKGRATKTKSKSKAKPKKKKVTIKKELSPEALEKRKAEREANKVKKKIAQLKEESLKNEEPKLATANLWPLFLSEKLLGVKDLNKSPILRAAGEEYRNLSGTDREALEQRAAKNKEENDRTYSAWVHSYTPLQIKNANLARKRLALYTEKQGKTPIKLRKIKDERQVKRSQGAFFIFFKERVDSGDFKNTPVREIAERVKVEYSNLSKYQKEHYVSRAKEDKERYLREYREVYGEEPLVVKEEKARKAAE